MRDVVQINKNKEGGRTIRLLAKNYQVNLDGEMQELLQLPYCSAHTSSLAGRLLLDPSTSSLATPLITSGMSPTAQPGYLPNVIISLRFFKTAVHKLVNDHGGRMPLASFLDCYKCCIYDHFEQGNTPPPT